MAFDESVSGVEAVFGQAKAQAQGELEGSSLLPFIFTLNAKDAQHLRLSASDFHSQTWQSDFSIQQLHDLRDDVGIGGSWHDFLAYVRAALSSDIVKLMLGRGGPATTTATLVAQKTKGTPRLCLPLTKLDGSAAEDARASISLGLFQAFHAQSAALVSETAQVAGLKALLAAEKEKSEKLQEQIDGSNLSFISRRKQNRTLSAQLPFAASVSYQPSQTVTQFDAEEAVIPSSQSALTGNVADRAELAVPKPPVTKRRGHVAPASRRVKRRGTAIAEETDT